MSYINKLFNYCYYCTKGPVLKTLKFYNKSQYWDIDKIEEFQTNKMRNLLIYADKYVPYYNILFKSIELNVEKCTIDEIKKIPPLTKDIINNNREQLISKIYKKYQYRSNSTGGSSGKILQFLNDKKNLYQSESIYLRNNAWANFKLGDKYCQLWGSKIDETNMKNILYKFINILHGREFFSSYNLTNNNMRNYMNSMNMFKPKILVGYPSSLKIFSIFLKKNNFKNISIKSIITSGETLEQEDRHYIENIFHCKVFNRYGSREISSISHECEMHDGLHINSEHIYLEIIKDKLDQYQDNEKYGKIIITDLDNFAMPFIRYEIGDLGKYHDCKCECGRNLPLMKILGRTYDIIIDKNGNYIDGHFFSRIIPSGNYGIKEFQIIQEEKGRIILKVVSEQDNLEKILVTKINKKLHNLIVDIEHVDSIQKPISGKRKIVISKINGND